MHLSAAHAIAAFTCVVMFVMAATHCAFDIHWLYTDNNRANALLEYATLCAEETSLSCDYDGRESALVQSSANVCWSSALLLVNVSTLMYSSRLAG